MSYIETIDIYDFALEKAIELCRSKIGFLGFLNDDESIVTIHAWSASVSKICEVKDKYIDFEVASTGIWGEVVRQRKSIIINDFTADNPLKRGVPQGHVSVTNYLSIPIFDNNKIVAIVAVGNKDDDYNDTDMQELSLLMQGTWTIMKQRKNEKELFDSKIRAEESEEKHRFLFENMIQGVVYHCSTGEIIYANEAASRILGLSEDQLYGKTSFDPRWRAIHEDGSDFPGETHPGMITLSTGQPVYNTIMGVFDYHNNSYRWININSIPKFKNNENKPSQVIVTFEDITELKTIAIELNKAKEKAEESDRLKSAFLQNMSHEIRTPLNAICGFSERLTLPNLDNQKLKFYTNIIITSSNQLLSIVNDVLTISALETKQERLNIEKVYLNNVISELKTIFTQEADRKNIALVSTHNLPASVSQVYADKSKIIQILSNLIANSLKFIKHGTIEFGYCKKGNELEFFVSDTGIGIDRSKFDLIFNRFTQADDTIQADYGGTGLGLSICKGFVELMGGRIWVESELGKGSTFYFSVPYNPVEVVTEHNVNQPIISSSIGGFSILVAEDQEYNFLYVEEFLSQMNCHVVHAKNGSKAVEICKNNPSIALVLMDIKMPVMDGYTAAKLIKEFRPNLPIIALTAYALELEVKKYSNAFTDYITKPITQATLLKAISPFFTTE
jgi:PAS domain S-box-containing protein